MKAVRIFGIETKIVNMPKKGKRKHIFMAFSAVSGVSTKWTSKKKDEGIAKFLQILLTF